MRRPNLFRTSAFRFTILYAVVFAASVIALLAFIYWRTAAMIDENTNEAIDSEIRNLADQYHQFGLPALLDAIRDRTGEHGNDDNVYLLTSPNLMPLAGNLRTWPTSAVANDHWLTLNLAKMDGDGKLRPHEVRARSFVLGGGYRLLVGRDTQDRILFRQLMIRAIAWSLTGAAALAIVGGMVISRRMLARVDAIAGTTRGIMAGALSERVPVSANGDEFDRLASSLNAMLDQNERLMSGMRLATDSLAHDLRRPLTRMKARAELALLQPPRVDRDRATLVGVLDEADAALATFDNLLKIAMAEAGAASDFMTVDMATIARDAADLYEPLAEDNGVSVTISAGTAAAIRGQRELLAQAVANLLDNAVKYTPPGGRIHVEVTVAVDSVMLIVSDSGPGIPVADRARVLERFVRLDESRSTPGCGLGLSLVAAVVRQHGGDIALEDNAPGLRVRIRLPTSAALGVGVSTADPFAEAASAVKSAPARNEGPDP